MNSVLVSKRLSGEDMAPGRSAGKRKNGGDDMNGSSKKSRGEGAKSADGWESLYDGALLVLNRDMEGSSKVGSVMVVFSFFI